MCWPIRLWVWWRLGASRTRPKRSRGRKGHTHLGDGDFCRYGRAWVGGGRLDRSPQQLTTQIGIGRKILLLAEHDEDGLARIDEHTRLDQAEQTEGQVRR